MTLSQHQGLRQDPSTLCLFLCFLRLGATAFGGPSMVAYIRMMAVKERRWLADESFLDGVALCQIIPGATAVQTAAYVGLRTHGVRGAAASFVGFGFPAFLSMMTLSALYARTHTLAPVISAFRGLQAIIAAIVANAALSFGKTSLRTWRSSVIALVAAAMFGLAVNPIFIVLLAAVLALLFNLASPAARQAGEAISWPPSTKPVLLLLGVTCVVLIMLFRVQRGLFDLARLLMRIDLFAFGGGFASVPFMLHEIVETHAWIDGPTFLNGVVLGQVTPGPIVITATIVGYLLHGPLGGLVATISVFLPSFLIVVGIVPYFDRLSASPYFARAIAGALCSFVGLLLSVSIRFGLNIHWSFSSALLASAAFIALLMKVDILWVVVIGAILSVVWL